MTDLSSPLLLLMSLGPALIGFAVLMDLLSSREVRRPALVFFIGLLLILTPVPVATIIWMI